MKKILLINDDGIDAPGLKCLFEALLPVGEIFISAPARQQSGKSLGITYLDPILVEHIKWENGITALKVEGTPADCVKVALNELDQIPDLIVSGVNDGSNSGRNILYSGTAGGVMEGVLRHIPGVAFSFVDTKNDPFQHVKKYIRKIVEHLFDHPLPRGTFLNVNFPSHAENEIKGIKLARQGEGYWIEKPKKEKQDDGRIRYFLGGKPIDCDEHVESDNALLEKGYITAVPIHIAELTDHDHLNTHKEHFEQLINKHFFEDLQS